MLLGRLDGRLEAWDLLDRTHQAVLVAQVSPCALTALATPAAAPTGGRTAAHVLAAGDAAGTLRLLELPRALRQCGHDESSAVAALLEHEQARMAAAAQRAAAMAADQKAAAAAAAAAARRQQQAAAAAAVAGPKEAEGEDPAAQAWAAAEQRYLRLEAEWMERSAAVAAAMH